jgi:DNA-binding GntR family transcriptional regulator
MTAEAARGLLPIAREGSGTTAEKVREVLTEAILDGVFAPGSHLNAEALARELGVSHIPVREALRALHTEGWVEFRPHAGAFIRRHVESELVDLFEFRVLVEGHAAALAAQRRTAADLEAMAATLDAQERATEAADLARINARFHAEVAAGAHNAILEDTIRAVGRRARFYFLAVAPGRREESLCEHRGILDAIRRRQSEQAEQLARRHVVCTTEQLLETMRGLPRAAGD